MEPSYEHQKRIEHSQDVSQITQQHIAASAASVQATKKMISQAQEAVRASRERLKIDPVAMLFDTQDFR